MKRCYRREFKWNSVAIAGSTRLPTLAAMFVTALVLAQKSRPDGLLPL
jgi:hypothetical protein